MGRRPNAARSAAVEKGKANVDWVDWGDDELVYAKRVGQVSMSGPEIRTTIYGVFILVCVIGVSLTGWMPLLYAALFATAASIYELLCVLWGNHQKRVADKFERACLEKEREWREKNAPKTIPVWCMGCGQLHNESEMTWDEQGELYRCEDCWCLRDDEINDCECKRCWRQWLEAEQEFKSRPVEVKAVEGPLEPPPPLTGKPDMEAAYTAQVYQMHAQIDQLKESQKEYQAKIDALQYELYFRGQPEHRELVGEQFDGRTGMRIQHYREYYPERRQPPACDCVRTVTFGGDVARTYKCKNCLDNE